MYEPGSQSMFRHHWEGREGEASHSCIGFNPLLRDEVQMRVINPML